MKGRFFMFSSFPILQRTLRTVKSKKTRLGAALCALLTLTNCAQSAQGIMPLSSRVPSDVAVQSSAGRTQSAHVGRHLDDVTGSSPGNSLIIADVSSSTYTVSSPGIYDTTGIVPYPDGANGTPIRQPLNARPRPMRPSHGYAPSDGAMLPSTLDLSGMSQRGKPTSTRKTDTTYIYTSCTQLYQAVTPGVHNPGTDIPLGAPNCVSFYLSTTDGPTFVATVGPVGGTSDTSKIQCSTNAVGQSWGCSTKASCQADYKRDIAMAPTLIAARLVIGGITITSVLGLISAGIGAAVAASGSASAIAIWAGAVAGGGAIVTNDVMQAMTNMTLHDAIGIESEAATLHQDEVNNGCATDPDVGSFTPKVVTYNITPGSW